MSSVRLSSGHRYGPMDDRTDGRTDVSPSKGGKMRALTHMDGTLIDHRRPNHAQRTTVRYGTRLGFVHQVEKTNEGSKEQAQDDIDVHQVPFVADHLYIQRARRSERIDTISIPLNSNTSQFIHPSIHTYIIFYPYHIPSYNLQPHSFIPSFTRRQYYTIHDTIHYTLA
jgi:hypothetical protein